MRIGPYRLESNLILAPMAGIADRPFRQLCRHLGAGLAVSEMISCDTTLWASPKTQRRLDHRGERTPISVQILGSNPSAMADAARLNVQRGADLIDINMGCPAKKVCRTAAGSALLRDEHRVQRILDAVVRAVPVPVTLKIRTGWDPGHRNGVVIAQIAEAAGIQCLAVHGRTRACGYSGKAEYETTRAIKEQVRIPVIANGDIDSPEKARDVLVSTGADALMIGRAAQGRPWIFGEVAHFLTTGRRAPAPELEWILEVLLGHLQALYEFYGERRGVRVARKHIAWYSSGYPGGATFRRQLNGMSQSRQQMASVKAFFERLATIEGGLAA